MKTDVVADLPALGFLGLGSMGSGMAQNLLKAGYPLTAFDISRDRLDACVAVGANAAENEEDAVKKSQIILASLRSSAIFVEVAEKHLLPHAAEGQIFIDLGTTEAPETRRLAHEFSAKGAALVDAPVSGGPQGASQGNLRIFVGGDEKTVARCRPILEVLGEPERVVYCGPSGAGQVVKGVNQLAMGLGTAAYLEAIAFGARTGVALEAIDQVVGGDEGWRRHFSGIARQLINGNEEIVVKFPELPYFLAEAQAQGFDIPLTQALYRFCADSKHEMLDNMGRPSRSFWRELMARQTSSDDGNS